MKNNLYSIRRKDNSPIAAALNAKGNSNLPVREVVTLCCIIFSLRNVDEQGVCGVELRHA